MRVKVDAAEMIRELEALKGRVADARPFWTAAGEVLRRRFAENFARGGVPAWTPLAESTARRKSGRVAGGGISPRSILIESGGYRASWTEEGAADNVTEVRADGVFVGTTWRWAHVHEHGWGRIPARSVARLVQEDLEEIARMGVLWLAGQWVEVTS